MSKRTLTISSTDNNNTIKYVGAAVALLFNYILFAYVDKLQRSGCFCRLEENIKAVKSSIMVSNIIIIGALIFPRRPLIVTLIVGVFNIVSNLSVFLYIIQLRNNCDCSKTTSREIFFYMYVLYYGYIGLALIVSAALYLYYLRLMYTAT